MSISRPHPSLIVGAGIPGDQHPGTSDGYRYPSPKLTSAPQTLPASGRHSGGHDQQSSAVRGFHAQGLRRSMGPSSMGNQVHVTQSPGSEESTPSVLAQDFDPEIAENYLREYTHGILSDRQIGHAFTSGRGKTAMERFMTDDSDIGNLHAYACGLPAPVYQLPAQLNFLVPNLTNPHPPPPPPEKRNRDRKHTQEAGYTDVGRTIEILLKDQQQRRKHGVSKNRSHRTRNRKAARPHLTT